MKKFKNEDGFTLIEMLIVMIIITVLILLIVPNIAKQSENVQESGCDALVKTVETQVQAYQLENKQYPDSMTDLINAEYITADQTSCQNGDEIVINADGVVSIDN